MRRLLNLRCRQPDALVFAHRLEHVVDEALDRGRADVTGIDRPGAGAQHRMAHACDLQNGHSRIIVVGSMDHPEYRFCPICGGHLETRQLKPGDPPRLVCASCGYVLYLDPKVAVGTIIRAGGDRLVLVRRQSSRVMACGYFPAGTSIAAKSSPRRRCEKRRRNPAWTCGWTD